jgi:hypothetical protein
VESFGGLGGRRGGGEDPDFFHVGNLDRIRDAPPNTTASVHRRDIVTMSELARRGFHLVDMSGEVWRMRRGN